MDSAGLSSGDLTNVWSDLSFLSVMFTLCFRSHRQAWRMVWILAGLCPTDEMSPLPPGRGRSRQVVIDALFTNESTISTWKSALLSS